MIIGKFQNAENGRITGELDALLVGRVKLTFEPNDSPLAWISLPFSGAKRAIQRIKSNSSPLFWIGAGLSGRPHRPRR
jgi:hypothetical protein